MNKKLLKKFRRYLELSVKFERSPNAIFQNIPKKEKISTTQIIYEGDSNGSYTLNYDLGCKKVFGEESRADMIMNAAKENAKLSNEYDEYKQLQRDLTEFLNAENKL